MISDFLAGGFSEAPIQSARAFRQVLDDGKDVANSMVAQALFSKAVGGGQQSVTAAIFWLKCRAGWKPVEGLELTGKDGQTLNNNETALALEQKLEALIAQQTASDN